MTWRGLPLRERMTRLTMSASGASLVGVSLGSFIVAFCALLAPKWSLVSVLLLIAGFLYMLQIHPRQRMILDPGGTNETFPVRVTYASDDLRLGEDCGWLTFIDGWVVFYGANSDFSVAKYDTTGGFQNGFTVNGV